MMFMWLNNNMRGDTSRARNANNFGAPEFVHPRFLVGFVLLNIQFSLQFLVDYCLSSCPFSVTIEWSVLRFTASDYLFKLFIMSLNQQHTKPLLKVYDNTKYISWVIIVFKFCSIKVFHIFHKTRYERIQGNPFLKNSFLSVINSTDFTSPKDF